MEAIGAAEKVFELIDREPIINHNCGQQEPEKLGGVVEFKDVHFTYPTRPDTEVLKGVSFTAQPGEVVALVGEIAMHSQQCYNECLISNVTGFICTLISKIHQHGIGVY